MLHAFLLLFPSEHFCSVPRKWGMVSWINKDILTKTYLWFNANTLAIVVLYLFPVAAMPRPNAGCMSSRRSSSFRSICRDRAYLDRYEAVTAKIPNRVACGGSLGKAMLDGDVPVALCVWISWVDVSGCTYVFQSLWSLIYNDPV